MLFKKIRSQGLAHNSYIIGDSGESVVIDPRRDIDIYLKNTTRQGYEITTVLETHRNEDFIIGSLELQKKTEALIFHADDHLDYQYGQPVKDEQIFEIGRLRLKALHTPGHTPGSFSYVLYGYEGKPLMVFSGDALFAGDVGRVDFLGEEKLEKTAGALYESIYDKILPLGDEVILCPAHGAGSVCASAIAERNWTTIGLEKKLNPHLQYESKKEFIQQVGQMLEYPPYFEKMEQYNLEGPPLLAENKEVKALSPGKFAVLSRQKDTVIIDTRMEVSFASAHIPGSISIWSEGLSSFAGWFIKSEKNILLVSEGDFPEKEIKYLNRLGFDKIEGYLAGGMVGWHMAAEKSVSINTVTVDKLCCLLDEKKVNFLLDIRSQDEINNDGEIPDSVNIHLTQLLKNLDQLPAEKDIYIFCGSGLRSMTAASLLKKEGYNNLNVVLGGLEGWSSTTCPIK